ncbi:hypothetical protein D3C78_1401680 [compost metagenome]
MTGQVEVRQVPVTPHVYGDGEAPQRIAKQTGQERGSHQGVILAPVEHVNRPGQCPAATGETGADQQVKGDPQPPGITSVEIGNRAQPEEEAFEDQHAAQHGKGGQHQHRPADQLAAKGIRLVITHDPCLPFHGPACPSPDHGHRLDGDRDRSSCCCDE